MFGMTELLLSGKPCIIMTSQILSKKKSKFQKIRQSGTEDLNGYTKVKNHLFTKNASGPLYLPVIKTDFEY